MKIYFARVQDTEGQWHRKVGKTSNLNKRFSDKRIYQDWHYIVTKEYDKDETINSDYSESELSEEDYDY